MALEVALEGQNVECLAVLQWKALPALSGAPAAGELVNQGHPDQTLIRGVEVARTDAQWMQK